MSKLVYELYVPFFGHRFIDLNSDSYKLCENILEICIKM